MAEENLVITLAEVPQLRTACSLVLADGAPGSGVKQVRLVSKKLCTAMLGAVQDYTLGLNGNIGSLLSEMAVLQGARLTRLSVIVTLPIDGEFLVHSQRTKLSTWM